MLEPLRQELAFEQMQAEASARGASEPGAPSQLGKRKAIYNAEALHELLEDLEYSQAADWHETQVLTAEAAEPLADVDDDLSRELSFYEQVRHSAGPLSLEPARCTGLLRARMFSGHWPTPRGCWCRVWRRPGRLLASLRRLACPGCGRPTTMRRWSRATTT